jgi:hypothetical protein
MSEFVAWPKIPRGSKQETITITEKMDGTNACIIVESEGMTSDAEGVQSEKFVVAGVQSRKRLITQGADTDNFGFAGWVADQGLELPKTLGVGYHYGEWVGMGIQKNPYHMEDRALFMFNSDRWRDGRQPRPAGVLCVPLMYEGPAVDDEGQDMIEASMEALIDKGIAYGYKPEGVVVWFSKARRYEKHTFAMSEGKWQS